VTVTDKDSGRRYVFPCGNWLSADEGDGKIIRTLFPESKSQSDYLSHSGQSEHNSTQVSKNVGGASIRSSQSDPRYVDKNQSDPRYLDKNQSDTRYSDKNQSDPRYSNREEAQYNKLDRSGRSSRNSPHDDIIDATDAANSYGGHEREYRYGGSPDSLRNRSTEGVRGGDNQAPLKYDARYQPERKLTNNSDIPPYKPPSGRTVEKIPERGRRPDEGGYEVRREPVSRAGQNTSSLDPHGDKTRDYSYKSSAQPQSYDERVYKAASGQSHTTPSPGYKTSGPSAPSGYQTSPIPPRYHTGSSASQNYSNVPQPVASPRSNLLATPHSSTSNQRYAPSVEPPLSSRSNQPQPDVRSNRNYSTTTEASVSSRMNPSLEDPPSRYSSRSNQKYSSPLEPPQYTRSDLQELLRPPSRSRQPTSLDNADRLDMFQTSSAKKTY